MDVSEVGVVARNLRQKVQGLQRSGVRFAPAGRHVVQDPPQPPPAPAISVAESPIAQAPARPVATERVTDRAHELTVLCKEVAGCTRCSELARTRTQTVFGVGNTQPTLCFVGEAPGADEDAKGEPFVGAAGQLLTKIIVAMGLKRSDVYICNVLKCRPPGNRTPAPDEVSNCRGFLERQIELLQPKYLCALGSVAAKALLDSQLSIGKLRGRFHQYLGIPLLCTYHPAYLLRNPDAKRDVWKDMQVLMQEMGLKVPEGGETRP
jgi:uracil-DNA glycosylase family 4